MEDRVEAGAVRDGAEEVEGVPHPLVLRDCGGGAQLKEDVQVTAGEAEAARQGLAAELVLLVSGVS